MRRSLAPLIQPLAVLALAVAVFVAWMHPAVLDPTNIGWLLDGNDRGQSAIGLAAYLRTGDPWPSLHQPLLNAPEGTTLLFTDSIPLLGLLLKPFASWTAPIQLVGSWYLACVLLHVGFATLLVRPYTADPLACWLAAALLTVLPVLLNRYGHASLCAQWLILWALWIFLDDRRSASPLWWAAMLGIAAAVHSYLLLICGAIWASALLRRGWHVGPLKILPVAALPLVPVALMICAHGVIGAGFLSSGTYGAYPAALDAWWNPANPSYSTLLPSSTLDETGGGGFEGFQYLGAGILMLAAMAIWVVGRGKIAGPHLEVLKRIAWLVPAALVLALVAVGPAPVWQGHPLASLALPRSIVDALDPVRASGRLLWLSTYLLVLATILSTLAHRRASLLLAAAFALQIVDFAPMMATIRATSARADDRGIFTRTRDARWQQIIARASSIQFEPAEPYRDLALMEEIEWRAIVACRPIRYVYTSRDRGITRARVAANARAFAAGRLDPTRLYVILGSDIPPAVADRIVRIDGVAMIPPSDRTELSCGTGLPLRPDLFQATGE